eukprot:9362251-Pyramimonas_sp.AAC.1
MGSALGHPWARSGPLWAASGASVGSAREPLWARLGRVWAAPGSLSGPVSYTHLTLPTILLV